MRYTVERDGFLWNIWKKWAEWYWPMPGTMYRTMGKTYDWSEQKNSIITSFNRNFAKRNDGNTKHHTLLLLLKLWLHWLSPVIWHLIRSLIHSLIPKGENKTESPEGLEAPAKGYSVEDAGYQEPAKDGSKVQVLVSTSERLQLLDTFRPWKEQIWMVSNFWSR